MNKLIKINIAIKPVHLTMHQKNINHVELNKPIGTNN